jgi:hypothetical protein
MEKSQLAELAELIAEEIKWLSDCPFRHGEYFYETAANTLYEQQEALAEGLEQHGMKETAEKIRNVTAELPEDFDEAGFYRDIAKELKNV